MKKGDVIKSVAQPIALVVDSVFGTDLQNCGGCNGMVIDLNNNMSFADAFYNRFWKQPTKEDNNNAIRSN